MPEQRITVPNIGDAHDVDVVEVLVQVGARIEREQALIVLESDKASMEVPSPHAGTVREVSVHVGDKVSAGSLILVIEAEEQPATTKPASSTEPAAKPASPVQPTAAPVSSNADQADQREDSVAQPVVRTALPPRGPTRTIPPAPPVPVSIAPKPEQRLAYASPAVRSYARELSVDLLHVPGTGKDARITKDDVQRYVKHAMSVVGTTPAASAFSVPDAPEIDFSQFGETSLLALTKIQRLSGKNLHRAWVTIPHVTQFDEADITELEEFRKKMRGDDPKLKLTLVTFFMKALVVALKAMPRFNSSLDKSGESLILKHYFHIGVAVDTPNGLMVPVIRDVDIKGLGVLAAELEVVSERARMRKLGLTDLQGASMTISSLGGIGGTAFTPIINPPEVAVLGVSRAAFRPVYKDGIFVPRLICPLSLSYDHRVIDGADAARFTTRLREILGDIRQMLL